MQFLFKLSRFLRPYWLWAVLAPLAMVGEVALDLMQPRLIQNIVDHGIARGDLPQIIHLGIWMVGLGSLGIIAGMTCTYFAVLAAQGFGSDLRHALFQKVQSLSFGNLDKLESGALITRLTNDVTQVQEAVLLLLRIMVRVPLLLIGSLIMAILTSSFLALLFLPLIPVVLTVLLVIVNKTYPMFGEVQHRLDNLNTVLQENLSGVRVVKAFARSHYERERFDTANDHLIAQNIGAARFSAVPMPVIMLALNAGIVAVLWLGGQRVSVGTLQVGQIIAFINYLMQTLMSLMMVSMLLVRISRAQASAERIGEVMESQPLVENPVNPQRPATIRGQVAFENVSFSYNGTDPVLKNISFVASPGKTVAILGATGAGKSSLVQLVPRFYDVTAGRVTLDGVDVRAIDEDTLRGTVAMALQESILFSGTIRDNIRYGRPDASEEEVKTAARAAQADEFITRFPDGYDTLVGQRGVNLSGGQKQRIAIARALLLHSPVLILDDSTSAVDVQTESRIQAALFKEHRGQTRLIVAQRISTVRNADQILVLDEGELVAQGTHDELLVSSRVYREIYESQAESGVIADVSL